MKKSLNTEDFETEILQLAEHIRLGQEIPNPQLWYERFSEFSHFFDIIDNAYLQSDKMVEMVNRSLEVSTKELYEANEKFRLVNKAMTAMVNSLDEGFLVIDQEGKCGQIISDAAKNYLGYEPIGEHLVDILKINTEDRETFNEWLNMIFNEVIEFEDLVELAPKHLNNTISQRKIEIKFKPIRNINDGKIVELVVILIDITERAEAERKLSEQKLFTDMVIKYLNNKSNFIRLIQMTKDVASTMSSWISHPDDWRENLNLLNRELHTLKGGLNTLSMSVISNKVHDIEEHILSLNKSEINLADGQNIRLLGHELQSCVSDFLQKHRRTFNIDNKSSVTKEVSTNSIYKFSTELLRKGHVDLLKNFTEEIISVPFASLFAPIESNLHSQSVKEGKSVDFTIIDPLLIKVVPEFYDNFFEQMVHIFNNILDHGLESDEERHAFNKDVPGKVVVKLNLLDKLNDKSKVLQIIITDDGRGINPVAIRAKLEDRGTDTSFESDEQVIYHIFDQGFSTRESATISSGRGIGMAAVLEVIQKMNGTIEVKSQYGKGTQFKIIIPYICELDKNLVEKLAGSLFVKSQNTAS